MEKLRSEKKASHGKYTDLKKRHGALESAASKAVGSHGWRGIVSARQRGEVKALKQHFGRDVHPFGGLFIAKVDWLS